MSFTSYNPFQSAVSAAKPGFKAATKAARIGIIAAHDELTSDKAIAVYERWDLQAKEALLGATIYAATVAHMAVIAFGDLAFDCGRMFGDQFWEGYYSDLYDGELVDDAPRTLPINPAIALLPASNDVAKQEQSAPLALPPASSVAPRTDFDSLIAASVFPAVASFEVLQSALMNVTRRELREACTRSNIDWVSRDRKEALARKLAESVLSMC